MNKFSSIILIRGGGDLASGVALRLHRVGLKVIITERSHPLSVRRLVSFSEAIYRGEITVEGVPAQRAQNSEQVLKILSKGQIPVVVDPDFQFVHEMKEGVLKTQAVIDARMTKRPPEYSKDIAPLVIGLGPGFIAGENCHAAIETNRGHFLGRVIWKGATQADTGIPEAVANQQGERVLRAPLDGVFHTKVEIGSQVKEGQILGEIHGHPIIAPFNGVLRGLIHGGITVDKNMKIGDLDPRDDPRYATLVSEKALAIGGGVLEALLHFPEIRSHLWT